jgi:asparagine synthase (glutamine-hydrolysing)
MRFFTCILDPLDRGISERVRQRYEALPRRRGLHFRWQSFDQMALLLTWDDTEDQPLVAQGQPGDWVAVGMARLDNRPDLLRRTKRGQSGMFDLEVIRHVIAERGVYCVPDFLGDFAFVAWQARSRTGVAACDAFAVRRLYYTERDGLVAFASRAEALATEEKYEVRYLAELVTLRPMSENISVYAGVKAVPRASTALLMPGRSIITRRYWHASDYPVESSWGNAEREAVERCRDLLAESVRLRMGGAGETWAQLSGGMDSSSIVSCAQWLAERGDCSDGLAGTVTFVDRAGTSTDEQDYSGAVVDRWKVPNVTIVDPPVWHDASSELPHLDQPSGDLPVYPRDRRLCAIVRGAGGRVLLTGSGGDQLFSGTMLFFADWIARGHVAAAIREMARRAAIGRVSFWQLAYRNAFLPFLPRAAHVRFVHDQDEVPAIPWLDYPRMKRLGIGRRPAVTAAGYGGKLGHKYHHAVVSMIATLVEHYQGGVIADSLDVRHPLLYRPLVEFALRLPPQLRARPHAHRWVLRQAMQGILPDRVRTRVGKPGTSDYLVWSLTSERERLAALTRTPILADLGVIEAAKLQAVFQDVSRRARGGEFLCGPLLNTLAVELWLRIRSGRWPVHDRTTIQQE